MPIIGVTGSQNTKGFLNPLAPTIGTATNVGTSRAYNNGAATVAFTAAATGSPATSFTATSSPGGYTATGASSPLTVTGLQSNTAYTFIVYGSNSVGPSANSSASNSITATTVAQAPTVGTISSNTGAVGRMNVPYTANATGGAAISTFTATSSPGSITGTGSSPIVVTGLNPGTSYTFTVTATNANGTSTASSASNSTAASQYYCSVGSVSGSTCTYAASGYTAYNCPASNGGPPCYNVYYNSPYAGCSNQGGTVRCNFQHKYYEGSSCNPACTTYTAYSCPSGGSLSGSTCTFSATIV